MKQQPSPGPNVPPTFTRALEFEGCVNFRDLGGYETGDGRRLRWRQLFRADGLHKLSEADRQQLGELGMSTVIDLRTVDEAHQRGRFPFEQVPVRYVALPLTDVLPATEELPSWRQSSYVASRYLEMVTRGGAALSAAIEALAAPGGLPAVFHCSAGKDRTGVLAALLLAFLGVPDESIVSDYALSALAMENLLGRLRLEFSESVEEVDRHAPAILRVMPETMEEFLSSVRADFASYNELAAHLGVTAPVEHLRMVLLESG